MHVDELVLMHWLATNTEEERGREEERERDKRGDKEIRVTLKSMPTKCRVI